VLDWELSFAEKPMVAYAAGLTNLTRAEQFRFFGILSPAPRSSTIQRLLDRTNGMQIRLGRTLVFVFLKLAG